MNDECTPCCDFCANADKCEHDEDGAVINEYVTCHIKNKEVNIGDGCKEHFKCRCHFGLGNNLNNRKEEKNEKLEYI